MTATPHLHDIPAAPPAPPGHPVTLIATAPVGGGWAWAVYNAMRNPIIGGYTAGYDTETEAAADGILFVQTIRAS